MNFKINKNKIFVFRTIAVLIVLVFSFGLLAVESAAKPATATDRVQIGEVKYSNVISGSDGSWNSNTNTSPASIGEVERLLIELNVGDNVLNNEKINIKLESDALDLSNASSMILVDSNGKKMGYGLGSTYSPRGSSDGFSRLSLDIQPEAIWKSKGSQIYIYLSATKTAKGKVNIILDKKAVTSFDSGEAVHVGNYAIVKQTWALGGVQLPAGMSGVANLDEAYVISVAGSEIVRIMIYDGQVLGLAHSNAYSVYALEFDITNRLYQNSVTKKAVMTRDEMQEVFNDLEFTFLRAPSESKWINNQDTYSSNATFIIK